MTTPDDDLPALRDDAAPRRTDAAFARAVAADVARRRGGLRALVPLLAPLSVGCAIFAFVFSRSPNAPSSLVPRPPPAAVVVAADVEGRAAAFDRDAIDAEVDDDLDAVGGDAVADAFDLDDVALLAFAGPAAADPAGFAFDGLEGSSDRELDDIERAFDAALAQKL
ncbi:MAG: hypothetical protein FJ137_00380 [Deltaproteobacteria bacterium]|nr:hypothetical protein [Deltaproteobacteria bacterium]